MVIPVKTVESLWKAVEGADNARLAKQKYPDDLVEVNDIEYVSDGHKYHKMDLYYPKNSHGKLPVIIDIHGGGWFYGDKELNKNYCLHLAQRGFAVFNISYRLCPEVNVKGQMQDCMNALKYINKIMNRYPCDDKHVFLVGDSAGGQLAAFVAAACESKKIRRVYDTVDPDISIKAVGLVSAVPYIKPHGLTSVYYTHIAGKRYKRESYAKHLDFDRILKECKSFPPTILFTSSMDVVAKWQTKRAYKCLKEKGVKAKLNYKLNPILMHVYQVTNPEDAASVKAMDAMAKFFKKYS